MLIGGKCLFLIILGASWTAVENTKTGDRAWRKFAYRIEDYVSVNSTFQIKFVASDSTRPGTILRWRKFS